MQMLCPPLEAGEAGEAEEAIYRVGRVLRGDFTFTFAIELPSVPNPVLS